MPKEDWTYTTIPKICKSMGYTLPSLTTLLDVGAGLSFKGQYIPSQTYIAMDIYQPFLEAIESDVIYVPILGDARNLDKIFLPKSIDMVIATDILEHLIKEDGLKLLQDIQNIAKLAVYIEVPETYIPQNIDIWGKGGHEWQTHRSTGEWTKEELESYGFVVSRRDYKMSNVQRHTVIDDINLNIVILDGIKFL